jgi:hypothetical protein
MWPEGKLSITEVTKRPLTAATLFKNSMIALVDNLASKVIILFSNCPFYLVDFLMCYREYMCDLLYMYLFLVKLNNIYLKCYNRISVLAFF